MLKWDKDKNVILDTEKTVLAGSLEYQLSVMNGYSYEYVCQVLAPSHSEAAQMWRKLNNGAGEKNIDNLKTYEPKTGNKYHYPTKQTVRAVCPFAVK